MALKVTSVRLDDKTLQRIDELAAQLSRPRAWLMAEAVRKFVDEQECFIAEVKRGLVAADQGQFIDHSEIRAIWEAKRAALGQVD